MEKLLELSLHVTGALHPHLRHLRLCKPVGRKKDESLGAGESPGCIPGPAVRGLQLLPGRFGNRGPGDSGEKGELELFREIKSQESPNPSYPLLFSHKKRASKEYLYIYIHTHTYFLIYLSLHTDTQGMPRQMCRRCRQQAGFVRGQGCVSIETIEPRASPKAFFCCPGEGNSTFPTAPLARWKRSGPRRLRERNPRRLPGVTQLQIHVRLFIVKAGLIIKMFIKHLAALTTKKKTPHVFQRVFQRKALSPPSGAGSTAANSRRN